MKIYSQVVVGLVAATLAACSTGLPKFQKNEKVSMTFQSGETWSEEIKKTAEETFIYAQMASNAYKGRSIYFRLPSNVELLGEDSQDNDEVGLAFNVYRITHPEEREIVVAFRGSENTLDWTKANIRGKQLIPALKSFEVLQNKYPGHSFSVVGDSLGGSLATQVSLCHKVKIAVSLNTSPRFRSKECDTKSIMGYNNRHSITEYGEAAKFLRLFGREATQLYTSINCRGGSTFKQHNVFDLALCLTSIASQNSKWAKESLDRVEGKLLALEEAEK